MNILHLSTFLVACFLMTNLFAQSGPIGSPSTTPTQIGPCNHKHQAEKIYQVRPDLRPENITSKPSPSKTCDLNRVIPIVVHIVHMCGDENIAVSQVLDGVNRINEAFNKMNNYGAFIPTTDPHYNNIADVGITFKLAQIDPAGNATTGITRTESSLTYVGGVMEPELKALINWDRSKYLNIWIVNNTGGSGYAQYPATVDQPPYVGYDGIVITHSYFGTTGTATGNYYPDIGTHEVGHWLNLIHTWGDLYYPNDPQACSDDDFVADTPNSNGNYSLTCSNTGPDTCPDPGVDNEHNFMDYSCEVMFTNGQKTRMWDCLCSPIAQRDTIGTAGSNAFTLIPNPATPRLTTNGYFFQESSTNYGSIQNTIEITLSAGSFVPTLINGTHYSVTPAIPLGLTITSINTSSNVVSFSFSGTASNHANSNDVTNFTINFNANAVTGVNHSSLFKPAISGLTIDFKDQGELVHESYTYTGGDPQCIAQINYQWTSWFSKYLGYVGMVHNSPDYHLYNEGSNPLELLCIQGTKNVANLPLGTPIAATVPGHTYELVGGGAPNDPDAVVLWSASHLAFDNTLGYAGFRFKTTCGLAYNYGWMSFYADAGAQSICIVDMVYSDDPDVTASPPVGNCFGNGDSTFDWVDQFDIENISNPSGNNGGYVDFSNLTITVDPSVGADFTLYKGGVPSYDAHWKIWIDFNANGSFNDPGERVYYKLQNASSPNNPNEVNYPLVPNTIPTGSYKLRVGISLYTDYNPCEQIQYGEFEDYTIQVTGNCVAPPATDVSSTVNNYTANLMSQAYGNVLHQFQYRIVGTTAWTVLPSSSLPNDVATGLFSCEQYEVQLRIDCGGTWSPYSASHLFTTTGTESVVKVLLEGPTDILTGIMSADLYDQGFLPGMTPVTGAPTPAGQPYIVAPWNYQGSEGVGYTDADYQAIFAATGQKPVDWVLLSFRGGTDASTESDKTAALLLQDGSIHFVDSCLALNTNQGYYIVVEHRNHLAIMSVGLVNYANNNFSITFYNQDSYNVTQTGSKLLNNGKWAMFSSDADASGTISAPDRSAIWNAKNLEGYLMEDVDLNGRCDAADRSDAWNNKNKVTQLP